MQFDEHYYTHLLVLIYFFGFLIFLWRTEGWPEGLPGRQSAPLTGCFGYLLYFVFLFFFLLAYTRPVFRSGIRELGVFFAPGAECLRLLF